jgi:hypothetical protein
MLRTLAAHLRAQWMGALALFLVIAGGTAYAANTIGSSDIIDGQVKSADIGNNQVYSADVRDDTLPNGGLVSADLKNNQAVRSADVANGTLNEEDVGQASLDNFAVDVGGVDAHQCAAFTIGGLHAELDHLLLTPSAHDSDPLLDYSIKYDPTGEDPALLACNRNDFDVDDGESHFNLLVFDAQ